MRFLSPILRSHVTTFQRALHVSKLLFSPAKHDMILKATFQNEVFTFTVNGDSPASFSLPQLKHAVASSIHQLRESVQKLLCIPISEIPVNQIADDFSPAALHSQAPNVILLEPVIALVWKGISEGLGHLQPLFNDQGLNRVSADTLYNEFYHVLKLAASAIVVATGGMNPNSFRHHCYSGYDRNVFLLLNGLLAFVNPMSSHRRTSCNLAIVVTPSELTQLLLVVITILLPIINSIRSLQGITIPAQYTHIFVKPRRQSKPSWAFVSTDSNVVVQKVMMDFCRVPLDGQSLRQIIHQVMNANVPLLLQNNMKIRSPVDDAGQHRYATGVVNYGVLSAFPRLRILRGDKPDRHIICSEIYHALTGTGPVNNSWRDMITGTALLPIAIFRDEAFAVARQSTIQYYGIQDVRTPLEISALVKKLLTVKPFLRGITASYY